jgi:hypothetical protein
MLLYLHDSIGFRSFHLHWVPHLVTNDLLEKRMEYAQAMLPVLHVTERDSWHHLVASDNPWFFLNTSSRRMLTLLTLLTLSTLSRDDVVIKPGLDIQSKKFIFAIMWNPSSFYVIKKLINDAKMNSDYFMTNILIPFE